MEIKNRFTGDIIIAGKYKYESIKDCLEKNRGANLRGADLRGADLRGAYLRGANLKGADLRGADLRGADLRDADLRGVDLRGADLRGADLRGADLRGVYLRDANIKFLLIRNSVQTILTIINWGILSDRLTLEMMRHDAESCGIEAMTEWAEYEGQRDKCPFRNGVRDYLFEENWKLWKPGKPKLRGIELLKALCQEKGYKFE